MNILIAPNAFKNALDSFSVAQAIEQGLNRSGLEAKTIRFPIADGGDNTLDVICQACKGEKVALRVEDPLGRMINAEYLFLKESQTAVVELATASGIHLLKTAELAPLTASTFGTGQLILHAIENGARHVILGVGGSASVDAGVGLLSALGFGFLDVNGKAIKRGGAGLGDIDSIQTEMVPQEVKDCGFTVICDVENQLTGEKGAAKVFGPQKGASQKQVEVLNHNLEKYGKLVLKTCGKDIRNIKHGGAAGGTSASLYAFLDAELVNGVEYILRFLEFEKKLQNIDLVITAEGKFDEQTISGKGPFGVAKIAHSKGIPVIMLCGQMPDSIPISMRSFVDCVFCISSGPQTLEQAIKNSAASLRKTAEEIGRLLKLGKGSSGRKA